jgi:hypothetical protein
MQCSSDPFYRRSLLLLHACGCCCFASSFVRSHFVLYMTDCSCGAPTHEGGGGSGWGLLAIEAASFFFGPPCVDLSAALLKPTARFLTIHRGNPLVLHAPARFTEVIRWCCMLRPWRSPSSPPPAALALLCPRLTIPWTQLAHCRWTHYRNTAFY